MSGQTRFHLMASAYWEPLAFELPEPPGGWSSGWRRLIDTARDTPDDIAGPGDAATLTEDRYELQARSVVLLFAPGGQDR